MLQVLTRAGTAALSVGGIVAAVYLVAVVRRLRRRRQVVVAPLVDATGTTALTGGLADGLATYLREQVDVQGRLARRYVTARLGSARHDDPTLDAAVQQRLVDGLRGQPQLPEAEASTAARTLVASLTAAVPEASRPLAQLLGDVAGRPAGWTARSSVRREPVIAGTGPLRLAFHVVLADLRGERPSRAVSLSMLAPLSQIPTAGAPTGASTGAAPTVDEAVAAAVVAAIPVLATFVAVELVRAELETALDRAWRHVAVLGPARRLLRRPERDDGSDRAAVHNTCGMIYASGIDRFSATANDSFADHAVRDFEAALALLGSAQPLARAAILGNLATTQQRKATVAGRSRSEALLLLRRAIVNYEQAGALLDDAAAQEPLPDDLAVLQVRRRLGLAVARIKCGDPADLDAAEGELDTLFQRPAGLWAEHLYNIACGYSQVAPTAPGLAHPGVAGGTVPDRLAKALRALAFALAVEPDNVRRWERCLHDNDLAPLRPYVPDLQSALRAGVPHPAPPARGERPALDDALKATVEALTERAVPGLVGGPPP